MILSERIKAKSEAIAEHTKQIIEDGNISDLWNAEAVLINAESFLADVICEIHKRSIEESIH